MTLQEELDELVYKKFGVKPLTPEQELAWKRKCEIHRLEMEQRTLKYKAECASENKALSKLLASAVLFASFNAWAIPVVWLSGDED
jgi:hypothetical protein